MDRDSICVYGLINYFVDIKLMDDYKQRLRSFENI